MNDIEINLCVKQMVYTFATNRTFDYPSDVHICNFEANSKFGKKMLRSIPTMLNPEFPMNVHSTSYMDVFDKDKLVYLTPHCRQDLVNFNPDDVYIIGAMVDKASSNQVSLAKAKKLGLRMARFPLDRYFTIQGYKTLTLNQVLEILLKLKMTNDWMTALSGSLPNRKISAVIEERNYKNDTIKIYRNKSKTFRDSKSKADEKRFEKFKKVNKYNALREE